MSKFRKKPVVIEAVKWNGYSNNLGLTNGEDGEESRYELPQWMPKISHVIDGELSGMAPIPPAGEIWRHGESLWIGTLEGSHRADPGDWIICGVKGELYPCKPDIFASTYDKVD